MRTSKITKGVLVALEKAADGYLALEFFYNNPSKVFYADTPKSHFRTVVYRLCQRGQIEKTIDEGKVILRLTEAGKDWVLKNTKDSSAKWDGVWRLVIFDIPESHRKVRWVLRNKLKGWGFVQWQKSVWASKKPLTGELRKLVADLGIEKWVLVIESSNTGLAYN